MSLFSLIFGNKPKTATIAKERLQLIIAHERSGQSSKPDFLPALQQELIAVISKYVSVNPDMVKETKRNVAHFEQRIMLDKATGRGLQDPADYDWE